MLHVARRAQATHGGCSALIFNPFGQVALRAQRALRLLADRLGRAGIATLRFDYFGTGDSDGDCEQADPERWVEDALQADAHLDAACPGTKRIWIGMELGFVVAKAALRRRASTVRGLVGWDPVWEPGRYLDDLERWHHEFMVSQLGPTWTAGEGEDRQGGFLGFPLAPALAPWLAAALPAADLRAVRADHIALFVSGETPTIAASVPATIAPVSKWSESNNDDVVSSGIVPTQQIAAIVEAVQKWP